MERISVIVPAYNNAPWLPRCLDSLLAQTHEDLEIVAVDDGSSDDTGAVLDGYAARHCRVRAIHQPHSGVTTARLRGVEAATGAWIGFVDGDDAVDGDMFRRLLQNALAYAADISHCGHRIVFPDGRVELVHGSGALRIQDRLTGLRDLLDGGQVESSLCTKLFRRSLFDGLKDRMDISVKNNEDYLMNFHLFSHAERAVFEDVCPYQYVLRSGSASYRQCTRNSIFDPIQVRRFIVATCAPELRSDARRALLRNLLFAYAQLSVGHGDDLDLWRRQVRQTLWEEREHMGLLTPRNRLLANMILYAPWSFRLAYGTYVKLFQRKEQH